jgi:hypothetical protein
LKNCTKSGAAEAQARAKTKIDTSEDEVAIFKHASPKYQLKLDGEKSDKQL